MTLQELMQKYGVTDPSKLFGGNLGALKTTHQDFYDQAGLSGASYRDAVANIAKKYADKKQLDEIDFGGLVPKNIGNTEESLMTGLNRPEYQFLQNEPGFMTDVNALNDKFGKLSGKIQVSPQLYSATLRHNQTPEGFQGSWIRDLNSIKYDPEYGAYLEAQGGNQDYGIDYYMPQAGMLKDLLSDPMFLMIATYGMGAALSGAGEASGALGGTESGWASGAEGMAAQEAGLGPEFLSDWGGSLSNQASAGGNMSWLEDWGYSPEDISFWEDFQFPSNSDVAPTFDPNSGFDVGMSDGAFDWDSFNQQWDSEYGNIMGNVDGPINDYGFSSNSWGDVLNYAKETGNYSSLLDKLKSSYDQYGKPIKSGYNAIDSLLSSGGAGGSNLMKILGSLGSSALGAYASNQQANATQALADKYASYGEPYRKRLADLYANPDGFLSSNEVQKPVQQGTNILARSLSTQGNPVASGNALQQLQSYSADQLFGKLGQEKDRLAGFGGLTNYNAAVPGLDSAAIGQKSNVFNAIGSGMSNIFNPQESLADILKRSGY